MRRTLLKGKIHRATLTHANLEYEGSITIDAELMRLADLLPYEKVQVAVVENGSRFETYAIAGEPGSGVVGLNGAAARLAAIGDRVIIMAYGLYDPEELATYRAPVVLVDEQNRPRQVREISTDMSVPG